MWGDAWRHGDKEERSSCLTFPEVQKKTWHLAFLRTNEGMRAQERKKEKETEPLVNHTLSSWRSVWTFRECKSWTKVSCWEKAFVNIRHIVSPHIHQTQEQTKKKSCFFFLHKSTVSWGSQLVAILSKCTCPRRNRCEFSCFVRLKQEDEETISQIWLKITVNSFCLLSPFTLLHKLNQ